MKIEKTPLEGLMLIEPSRFRDERGFFLEMFQRGRYREAGFAEDFVQENHSRSMQGVLRGLHYQVKRPQAQIVTVMRGRIFDVAVDLRPASPTFGRHFGIELNDEDPRQLYMAPGFAHGFCVLSDWADIHYAVSRYYDHSDERGVVWNDPDINITWPINTPRLSPRDAAFPKLRDLSPDQLPHKPFHVWEGVYTTFTEAAGDEAVFQSDIWLDKIVKRAQTALTLTQEKTSIAPVAVTTDYALPFVAALSSCGGQPLRILDFGGGMATSFLPLAAMLSGDQPIEYVVVENASVCVEGRKLFKEDARVQFTTDFPAAGAVDIVHAGSSIHYVDDWLGTLARFAGLRPKFILFSDLPAGDIRTFVTAQMFYGQRIPVRFWNFGEFVSAMETLGYKLLFKARYRGYELAPVEELPTGHFDSEHRLTYLSQLIFQRVVNKTNG